MEKEEMLLKAANLFEKARKIELRANPNNEEDFAIAIQKADRILLDAFFNLGVALYGGAKNGRIN